MTTPAEAYAKLKAPKPTEQVCKCTNKPPVKLVMEPGFNPLRCVTCGLEVTPEALKLSVEQAEALATWNGCAVGIYNLWLAAGEYQTWAERQMLELGSPVNVDGRKLAEDLKPVRRAYYWVFTGDEPLAQCPRCGGETTQAAGASAPQAFCNDCSLIGTGAS
jgi:hypothetical protein